MTDFKQYKWAIELGVLLVSLYAAVLSTYIVSRDSSHKENKFYLKSEVITAKSENDEYSSYVKVSIQNIGVNSVQLMPNINIGVVTRKIDLKKPTQPKVYAFGAQIMPNCDEDLFVDFIPSGLTKKLGPGEIACARSSFFSNSDILDPENLYSINLGPVK